MTRKLLPLLAAIIALSFIVYLVAVRPASTDDEQLGTHLLPGVAARLGEATGVRIRTGDEEVVLELAEGRWLVASRHGYPVDFGKLSSLLTGLAEARISERKTAKPENHHLLGLSPVEEEGSEAKEVSIKLGDTDEHVVLIGDRGAGRGGTYVRLPDDPQVWLVDREVDVTTTASRWLDSAIIDIDAERVSAVTMAAVDGTPLHAVRGEDPEGNLELDAIPPGRKLKYATIVATLGRALTNVRLEDVRPADGFDWSGSGSAEFTCSDGLVVTVSTKEVGDHHYLGFTATDDELNARLAPWVFDVTDYTFDQLTKTMEDLTDEEAAAEEVDS